eukprot:10806176-Alexandrium_andersonii.AAC.1
MPPMPNTSEDDEGTWEGCLTKSMVIVDITLQPASSASEGEPEKERNIISEGVRASQGERNIVKRDRRT